MFFAQGQFYFFVLCYFAGFPVFRLRVILISFFAFPGFCSVREILALCQYYVVRGPIRTVSVVILQPLLYSVYPVCQTVRLTPLQVLLLLHSLTRALSQHFGPIVRDSKATLQTCPTSISNTCSQLIDPRAQVPQKSGSSVRPANRMAHNHAQCTQSSLPEPPELP